MRRSVVGSWVALVFVLAVALALRLYGLNWDGGQWIHPDERMILMVVSNRLSIPTAEQVPLLLTPQSPLNPAFHAYGSFPLYLLKAVQLLVGNAVPLHIPARLLSVAFDCGTVLLAYALGASLAGAWWGVLAALLVAVSPIHVQLAHYYTVDTILACWTALGAYFALRLAATGRLRWALAVGAVAGLAMATKLIGAAVVLFAALALAVRLLAGGRWSWRGALRAAGWCAAAGGVALAVFVLADPYALIDAWAFWGEAGNQALMARGDPRFPYTLQFYYTLPYLYPLWQNLTRGWGIGAGLLAWGGLVWATVRAGLRIRRPDGWAVLAAWALAFFLVVGGWHAKFPRYLLPMMPLLCVLAAGMLANVGHRWRARGLRVALAAITAILIAATGAYAVGLLGIFGQEHSWVRMSRWMYANVPRLAAVATEYWDMALPLPLTVEGRHHDRGDFRLTELSLYDADTPEKWAKLAETLAATDYYIVASQRVYGPVGLLRELYPTTSRFYALLFQERLGFRLVHWEGTDMQVLGVRMVENPFARAGLPVPEAIVRTWQEGRALLLPGADESWTVYDRPLVMVFRNEGRLSAAEIQAALMPAEP
ncbi:MAG: hypothetical protein Kow00123_12470 [Anaerolineales bacterium]